MNLYERALKKADQEDHNYANRLPWIQTQGRKYSVERINTSECSIHSQIQKIPSPVINNFDILGEKIRSITKIKHSKIIGVTGAVPQQGVTTLISLIALVMAAKKRIKPFENDGIEYKIPQISALSQQSDLPIMLIDAQVKNPSIEKIFNVHHEKDLYKILNTEGAFEFTSQETFFPALRVIPIGQNKEKPLDLEKLKLILEDFKSSYEYIFIDIPPVLSSAESILLSKLCDGILMIVRARQIRGEVLQEATQILENAGIKILGSILNRREYSIPDWIYRRL